jgi:hypothetical protein
MGKALAEPRGLRRESAGPCPCGGDHTTRAWHDGDREGLSCRFCHKTWELTAEGYVPTWAEAASAG